MARFPNDNLGIIVLSNDANGDIIMESVKWRIAEEILGLREIDWNARYDSLTTYSSFSKRTPTGIRSNTMITGTRNATSPPLPLHLFPHPLLSGT